MGRFCYAGGVELGGTGEIVCLSVVRPGQFPMDMKCQSQALNGGA